MNRIMPPVGTLIQDASPTEETVIPKEETPTAGNNAPAALPSLGKYAMVVNFPKPLDDVMQNTPDITPRCQQGHSTALATSMQDVPINPSARDATRVNAEEVEEVV